MNGNITSEVMDISFRHHFPGYFNGSIIHTCKDASTVLAGLSCLAILNNLVVVSVRLQKEMRNSSNNSMLLVLGAMDMIALVFYQILVGVASYGKYYITDCVPETIAYVTMLSLCASEIFFSASTWVTVFIAVMRYKVICRKPLVAKKMLIKHVFLVVGIICVFSVLEILPLMLTVTVRKHSVIVDNMTSVNPISSSVIINTNSIGSSRNNGSDSCHHVAFSDMFLDNSRVMPLMMLLHNLLQGPVAVVILCFCSGSIIYTLVKSR